jgi:hypothetical protein
MGAWQGVAMDSLKFHPGPPCANLLRPEDVPPLKRSAHTAGSLWPFFTLLDTPRRTPMVSLNLALLSSAPLLPIPPLFRPFNIQTYDPYPCLTGVLIRFILHQTRIHHD